MKTYKINGKDVAFTECTFISEVDGSTQYGLYIHEVDDENRDGDMVISNGCEMPETAEDAEALLFNETGCSDSDVLRTVRFMDEPKQISVDNGIHFVTPAEAIDQQPWEVIVQYMDDETRENVNAELAPCSELEFLTRYLELAPEDLVIG